MRSNCTFQSVHLFVQIFDSTSFFFLLSSFDWQSQSHCQYPYQNFDIYPKFTLNSHFAFQNGRTSISAIFSLLFLAAFDKICLFVCLAFFCFSIFIEFISSRKSDATAAILLISTLFANTRRMTGFGRCCYFSYSEEEKNLLMFSVKAKFMHGWLCHSIKMGIDIWVNIHRYCNLN